MGLINDLVNAVREEWDLPKLERVNPKQQVCNLHIDINGWQRTYRNLDYQTFLSNSKKLGVLGKFRGDFRLLMDGSLIPSIPDEGFHSYGAEIDLDEVYKINFSTTKFGPLRYLGLPHLHFVPGGEIVGHIHPDSLEDRSELKLTSCPFSRPHYTLKGLYNSLEDEKFNTKINALRDELGRGGYVDNSIANRKQTKLKLLENRYRRKVSNQ
jgi:hypothetical protein